MRSPTVKDDWVVEHRLSRLVSSERCLELISNNYNIPQALDPNNSPGWDTESSAGAGAASRLPLFVKTVLSVPPSPQQEIQVHRGSVASTN